MKNILTILFILISIGVYSQSGIIKNYPEYPQHNEPWTVWDTAATKANLDLHPYKYTGQISYVWDIDSFYVYDGSSWSNLDNFISSLDSITMATKYDLDTTLANAVNIRTDDIPTEGNWTNSGTHKWLQPIYFGDTSESAIPDSAATATSLHVLGGSKFDKDVKVGDSLFVGGAVLVWDGDSYEPITGGDSFFIESGTTVAYTGTIKGADYLDSTNFRFYDGAEYVDKFVAAYESGVNNIEIDTVIALDRSISLASYPNLTLTFTRSGYLDGSAGSYTITFNKTRIINPDNHQIFDINTTVNGSVRFDYATPEWYGAVSDANYYDQSRESWYSDALFTKASTDNTDEINATSILCANANAPMITNGNYYCNDKIHIYSDWTNLGGEIRFNPNPTFDISAYGFVNIEQPTNRTQYKFTGFAGNVTNYDNGNRDLNELFTKWTDSTKYNFVPINSGNLPLIDSISKKYVGWKLILKSPLLKNGYRYNWNSSASGITAIHGRSGGIESALYDEQGWVFRINNSRGGVYPPTIVEDLPHYFRKSDHSLTENYQDVPYFDEDSSYFFDDYVRYEYPAGSGDTLVYRNSYKSTGPTAANINRTTPSGKAYAPYGYWRFGIEADGDTANVNDHSYTIWECVRTEAKLVEMGSPILIKNLKINVGDTVTNSDSRHVLYIKRDNCTIENVDVKGAHARIIASGTYGVNIKRTDVNITDRTGTTSTFYHVSLLCNSNITFDNCDFSSGLYSQGGGWNNAVKYYNSVIQDNDDHLGGNYTFENCIFYGHMSYDGYNIQFNNCKSYGDIILTAHDAGYAGNVVVRDHVLYYDTNYIVNSGLIYLLPDVIYGKTNLVLDNISIENHSRVSIPTIYLMGSGNGTANALTQKGKIMLYGSVQINNIVSDIPADLYAFNYFSNTVPRWLDGVDTTAYMNVFISNIKGFNSVYGRVRYQPYENIYEYDVSPNLGDADMHNKLKTNITYFNVDSVELLISDNIIGSISLINSTQKLAFDIQDYLGSYSYPIIYTNSIRTYDDPTIYINGDYGTAVNTTYINNFGNTTDEISEGSTNLYSQWVNSSNGIKYNGGSIGINVPDTYTSYTIEGQTLTSGWSRIKADNTELKDFKYLYSTSSAHEVGEYVERWGGTLSAPDNAPSNSFIKYNQYYARIGGVTQNIYNEYARLYGTTGFYIKWETWNGSAVAERMRIDRTGNVGINNNSPSEVLDVGGNIALSGSINQATISASLTDGTPTDAEIDAATGTTPAGAGSGAKYTILDSDGTGLIYIVVSDGTNWQYTALTVAL